MSVRSAVPLVTATGDRAHANVRHAATSRFGVGWAEAIAAGAALIVFLTALEVLRVELRTVTWDALVRDVVAVPRTHLIAAFMLTALNYVVLTGYDLLAFIYIGKPLSRARIMLTSFLAYAVSNNVGLAMFSGASIRYRFYSRQGVTADELTRLVFSYSVTFWLGLFALGGLGLATAPLPQLVWAPARIAVMGAGWLLMLLPPAYLVAVAIRRAPVRLWRLTFPMPTLPVAAGQLALSLLDWTLIGAVLFVLLPPSSLSFVQFMGAFLAAILLGMASHVPGGLGVFEGVIVLLLRPYLASAEILPALVVYRLVYYLLPLSIALPILIADELHQRRSNVARIGAALGRISLQFTPRAMSALTFVTGIVLLFSGATPAEVGRIAVLGRVLPLGVIEASHFLASVAGAGLLVLSQGLARRLDGAYFLTAALMVVGIATSLLKGFDYEEAALLCVVLVLLHRARPAFDRRAAFFETRFSASWTATVAGAVAASVWLGLFAFEHVEYSRQLWWSFELHGDASRFLRASVGAGVVLLLVALAQLIGYAPHEAAAPTEDDLRDAERVMATGESTVANLVFLRDKTVLFDEDRTAFIMYAVQGRTWVALGDPVGPDRHLDGVMRRFLERCQDFGGVPVFYEVAPRHLHRYADLGLTFVKLGEEARVDLEPFTLQGRDTAKLRQALHRLERQGASFRVIPAAGVGAILGELRDVSNEWLAAKRVAEKGFSLGFFDETYLQRFPVAIIERDGRIDAFATVWPGRCHGELSIDLMRHRSDAPNGVMEGLFVHLMQWGRDQSYRWFSLGMAPLAGVEQSPLSSLWNGLGAFLYEHGESFYNFQGLRAYKNKFNPVWQPRYLAYPGGLRLPRILADTSALIAGGYRRIFLK